MDRSHPDVVISEICVQGMNEIDIINNYCLRCQFKKSPKHFHLFGSFSENLTIGFVQVLITLLTSKRIKTNISTKKFKFFVIVWSGFFFMVLKSGAWLRVKFFLRSSSLIAYALNAKLTSNKKTLDFWRAVYHERRTMLS